MERLDQSDAGLYTCVAWNVEGADTRSVSVFVDSWGRGSEPSPSGEEPWGGNSSGSSASLVLQAKVPPPSPSSPTYSPYSFFFSS